MDRDQASIPDLTYTCRQSLVGAATELRLGSDALEYRVGTRTGRVPYTAIRRVRLSFRPANLQAQRFLTEIWPDLGSKIQIASTSRRSITEFERHDAAYRAFVMALHAKIAAARPDASFESGTAPVVYWSGLALFAAIALGLAALTVEALRSAMWGGVAFVAAFLALFLWQMGGYFRRNRPRRNDPAALPADILPP